MEDFGIELKPQHQAFVDRLLQVCQKDDRVAYAIERASTSFISLEFPVKLHPGVFSHYRLTLHH